MSDIKNEMIGAVLNLSDAKAELVLKILKIKTDDRTLEKLCNFVKEHAKDMTLAEISAEIDKMAG